MAAPMFTFGGLNYDLSDVAQAAAAMTAMATASQMNQQLINQQAAQITTLQQSPALNQAQFQQLVNTLQNPAAQVAPQRVQAINPVLSTPGNDVPYEEHQVPAGIEDVKSFPMPAPFDGRQVDAEPFIIRLKAYFVAKPKAMRYTRNRILTACNLLNNKKTAAWASLVSKALATGTNNSYYYDEWSLFQQEFLKRYGLTNAPQHYFRLLTQYRQYRDQDCKSYTDEFERLRLEAAMDKSNAFQYLRQGTLGPVRATLP